MSPVEGFRLCCPLENETHEEAFYTGLDQGLVGSSFSQTEGWFLWFTPSRKGAGPPHYTVKEVKLVSFWTPNYMGKRYLPDVSPVSPSSTPNELLGTHICTRKEVVAFTSVLINQW